MGSGMVSQGFSPGSTTVEEANPGSLDSFQRIHRASQGDMVLPGNACFEPKALRSERA